jgi:hypothetical protein
MRCGNVTTRDLKTSRIGAKLSDLSLPIPLHRHATLSSKRSTMQICLNLSSYMTALEIFRPSITFQSSSIDSPDSQYQ